MSDEIVHIAGPMIGLKFKVKQENTRVIQRCIICGEKLVEKKATPKRKNLMFFDPGACVVKPDKGRPYSVLPRDSGLLHENTCARLVEEEIEDDISEEEKAALAEQAEEEENEEG